MKRCTETFTESVTCVDVFATVFFGTMHDDEYKRHIIALYNRRKKNPHMPFVARTIMIGGKVTRDESTCLRV